MCFRDEVFSSIGSRSSQYHMCISSGKGKRRHPCERTALFLWPGTMSLLCRQAKVLERDCRVNRLEIQSRGYFAVMERKCYLDHTSNSSSRFQVTDIGLYRPYQARVHASRTRTNYFTKSLCLDRITSRKPRAMKFDIIDL